MTKLTSLKNIGRELERKLRLVGIDTAEELKRIGSEVVFVKLKEQFPRVCSVHLYSLEGAIQNVDFSALQEETKSKLKLFSSKLK